MLINTKYFGEVEIDDDEIITFPEPILGFDDLSGFVLLRFYDEPDSMFCLQSTEDPELAFVVINPLYVVENYTVTFSDEDSKVLEADEETAFAFYCILVVRENLKESTVNLRCPVVINTDKKLGKQIIMDNMSYSMRHPIGESV